MSRNFRTLMKASDFWRFCEKPFRKEGSRNSYRCQGDRKLNSRSPLPFLSGKSNKAGGRSPSPPPPSPSSQEEAEGEGYYFWASDGGSLYPEALYHFWQIPLSHLCLVCPPTPQEVWRVGLEAIQTGLFGWVFLRPSLPCHPSHLRKLQLHAEKTRTRVLLFSENKLPHWMCTLNVEVSGRYPLPFHTPPPRHSGRTMNAVAYEKEVGTFETDPLSQQLSAASPTGGGLSRTDTQDIRTTPPRAFSRY